MLLLRFDTSPCTFHVRNFKWHWDSLSTHASWAKPMYSLNRYVIGHTQLVFQEIFEYGFCTLIVWF